ncbi:MAG TPA: acyltransferase [Alcaligenaceae bacterium]|nr:acyltransferase [Alcaligenaceae bacterium]
MSNSYRADLDGLRAVAILCVVVFHAYPQLLPAGLMGVDLFFVLSGYLITSLLQRQSLGSIKDIGLFYARRLQRLYPPLLLFLLVMLLLAGLGPASDIYSGLWRYALSAGAFGMNVHLAIDDGLLGDRYTYNPFLHLWSLGIEGQFYVLWPWVFWFGLRTKHWKVVLFLMLCGSLFSAGMLYGMGADRWLFYAPSSRLFEMVFGAALACHGKTLSPQYDRYSLVLILAFMCLAVLWIRPDQPYPNLATALPVMAATLFIYNSPQHPLNQWLAAKPLVYIGRMSYSWYLWHWGLFALYQSWLPMWLLIPISFMLARLSYHGLERPLQRWRQGRNSSGD